MEIRTFFARLDTFLNYVHVGERGIEIAVRAGDHVGEASGGRVDEGLVASKHGEFKRDWIDMKTTREVSLNPERVPYPRC